MNRRRTGAGNKRIEKCQQPLINPQLSVGDAGLERRSKKESEFRHDYARKDGLRIYCKGCDRVYAIKRRKEKPKADRKYLRCEDRHRAVNGIEDKYYRNCGKWKKESKYYKQRSTKDGLTAQCQECTYKSAKKSGKIRQ